MAGGITSTMRSNGNVVYVVRVAKALHNTVAVRVRVLGHSRFRPLHTTRLGIRRIIQRDVAGTNAMPLR